MRKVIMVLMLMIYLMAFPPFIAVYNKVGFCFGIPNFIFGLLILSLGMVLVTFILYRYENKKKDGGQS